MNPNLLNSQNSHAKALTTSHEAIYLIHINPMDVLSFASSTIAPRRLRPAGFLFARKQLGDPW